MTAYRDAVISAMSALAEDPRMIFVGQTVVAGGAQLGATLAHIPDDRKVEFPVAENLQMGFCAGLALAGWLPVCVFPRVNFLIETLPQLVQHLDKLPDMGAGSPRVIIRTAVASPAPMDPGPQHLGNPAPALRLLLKHVRVVELFDANEIANEYRRAARRDGSTILVEFLRMYSDE